MGIPGSGFDVYEAGKEDVVKKELHGGNFPMSTAGAEDFGEVSGGSLANGLCCKKPFMDELPEELGMGTAGPNQTPIGPAAHSAKRGHRFG